MSQSNRGIVNDSICLSNLNISKDKSAEKRKSSRGKGSFIRKKYKKKRNDQASFLKFSIESKSGKKNRETHTLMPYS